MAARLRFKVLSTSITENRVDQEDNKMQPHNNIS